MKILLRKSVVVTSLSEEKTPDKRLEYFKGLLMDHLDRLSERKSLKKSLLLIMTKGGKGLPVGSIREWKGKKYIKTPSGKWKPHGRGASKTAEVKEQIASARNQLDLFHIIEGNKDLFSDAKGKPLPVVMDLFGEISSPKTPAPKKNTPSKKLSAKPKLQEAGADLFAPLVESKPKIEPEMPNPAPKNNPLGWSKDFPETLQGILDYNNAEPTEADIKYVSNAYWEEIPFPEVKDWFIKRYKTRDIPTIWKMMCTEINELMKHKKVGTRIDMLDRKTGKHPYQSLMKEFIMKTGFERGTHSNVDFEAKDRNRWESIIAGHSVNDVIPQDRPFYGAIDVLENDIKDCDFYGHSLIVFKDSVKSRTTYTIGNSSAMIGSFQSDALTMAKQRDRLTDPQREIGHTPFGSFKTLMDKKIGNYMEAQIWGRAGIDEIEEIKLHKDEYTVIMKDKQAVEWLDRLRAKGVKISTMN